MIPQEQIDKYNPMIAIFIGGTLDSPNSPYFYFIDKGRYEKELLYHSDWNWIHEVIEKITKEIGIRSIDECTELEWRYYKLICDLRLNKSIQYVYNSICNYLDWYNERKEN